MIDIEPEPNPIDDQTTPARLPVVPWQWLQAVEWSARNSVEIPLAHLEIICIEELGPPPPDGGAGLWSARRQKAAIGHLGRV